MAELADALDLGSSGAICAGSSPVTCTILWPVGEAVEHTCLSRMHSWVQIPYGSPFRLLRLSFDNLFFIFRIMNACQPCHNIAPAIQSKELTTALSLIFLQYYQLLKFV